MAGLLISVSKDTRAHLQAQIRSVELECQQLRQQLAPKISVASPFWTMPEDSDDADDFSTKKAKIDASGFYTPQTKASFNDNPLYRPKISCTGIN